MRPITGPMCVPKDRRRLFLKGNAETWKAVKGFCDGSCKDNGKKWVWSGDGVDIRRWATISRIAVHLKVGTAMAAELMGACVLTGILDLIFHKCLCAECQPMYEACVRRRTI